VALIEPSDVERLFRAVVTTLAERDPARLSAPLQVAELYQQIVPYRTHRARLGFDTHQDYEGAILGLLAGIGGYADLEPVEARDALAAEAGSPNPDAGLVREFAGARVLLNARRVRDVLDAQTSFAPPPAVSPPTPPPPASQPPEPAILPAPPLPEPSPAAAPPFALEAGMSCPRCSRPLPTDRPVVFCPYCGTTVGATVCTRCGDELRPDWQFCPRCGHASGK
jgi:RNA polymerase subunit RPABC4/transcription elongation factor Spt4